jgi:hypothetical protein
MSGEKKPDPGRGANSHSGGKGTAKKSPARKGHLFTRWQNPSENRMGNDISSELKIANSKGGREGGTDKGWHMDEGE